LISGDRNNHIAWLKPRRTSRRILLDPLNNNTSRRVINRHPQTPIAGVGGGAEAFFCTTLRTTPAEVHAAAIDVTFSIATS